MHASLNWLLNCKYCLFHLFFEVYCRIWDYSIKIFCALIISFWSLIIAFKLNSKTTYFWIRQQLIIWKWFYSSSIFKLLIENWRNANLANKVGLAFRIGFIFKAIFNSFEPWKLFELFLIGSSVRWLVKIWHFKLQIYFIGIL